MNNLLLFYFQLALIGSLVLVNTKTCLIASVSYETATKQLKWNGTLIEQFVDQFYFDIQLYHIIILSIALIILILGFVNIAPENDDVRFGFHFLVNILLNNYCNDYSI